MLKSISIINYALIDSLEIEFEAGFTIMTGETGAGKSIILGALGLILGQRADTTVLRDKSKKCIVEGTFQIKGYQLENYFLNEELDYNETTILRREITVTGTSRAFINDTPVNIKTLWELGLQLVDIHSQHQNLELSKNQFQLKLVDLVAGNNKLLSEYSARFNEYLLAKKAIQELEELAVQSKTDLDYYQFQFKQLEEARLQESEQEELEQELDRLNHAEEIQATFGKLAHELEGEGQNILGNIKEQLNQLNRLKEHFSRVEEIFHRINTCYIELKDIANEAASIAENVENNPEKQALVSQRLDLLYSLQQKHRVSTISELLNIYHELDERIQKVSSYDDQIEQLKDNLQHLYTSLEDLSLQLRNSRKSVVKKIEEKVVGVLREVGIINAEFVVRFGELPAFSMTGKDSVSFLFSANKNSLPEDISKVASGGEMSRLMLAVKTLITDTKALPTIVFDEIDAGISGEIAIKVGQIIRGLSKTVQVINITHLPQIAARGDHHFLVYKYDTNEKTFTSIRKLNDEERIIELAKMIGGENYSPKAIETARELLENYQ